MSLRRFILLFLTPLLITISAFATPPAPPDEGMWLLTLVNKYNYDVMKQLGCKLTPDQIYSEQEPSLKDAIVSFGDFCTAEFVSQDGLLFTNHHCGYDAVANHSTVDNDLLDNGFWSKDHSQELTNPGLFVKVLVRMQDVTDSVVPKLKDLSQEDRQKKVQEVSKSLAAHASLDGKYKAEVKSMYYGNQYFLFVYQVFHDIRLVAAPPASIGKFGGDTDNWMWPRHTGDFSVFRVYADKNNNPTADYAADNVPYKPKHFLPISLKGFNKGDFAMIIGFPGSTDRYLTSYAIEEVINYKNPALIKVIKIMTDQMKADMDRDPKLRLQLASDYATMMNSQKLFESQLPGLKKLDLVGRKQEEEAGFMAWAKQQPSGDQYVQMMDDLKNTYAQMGKVEVPFYYTIFNVNYTPAGKFALEVNQMEGVLGKDAAADARQKTMDEVKKSAAEYFGKQAVETEKKMLLNLLVLYEQEKPGGELPQPIADILTKYKGATPKEKFAAFVDEAFSKSLLTSKDRFDAFMAKPSMKTLQKDALYNYYMGIYAKSAEYRQQYAALNRQIAKDMRVYLQGQLERDPNRRMYPDANFTLRLTYGTIDDYMPRDAVHYNWMTTLSGVIEKADSTNEDFMLPGRMKDLYAKKDFGRYNFNGDVPVCFLSTNDITGGNSGSPVMNANGELIGLAFDGNYEGTAGDYEVDPDFNRTISVDIRYVLFIIEKYAGDMTLINELKIQQ